MLCSTTGTVVNKKAKSVDVKAARVKDCIKRLHQNSNDLPERSNVSNIKTKVVKTNPVKFEKRQIHSRRPGKYYQLWHPKKESNVKAEPVSTHAAPLTSNKEVQSW